MLYFVFIRYAITSLINPLICFLIQKSAEARNRSSWPVLQRYYIWKTKQAEAQSQIWTDPNGYYFLNIMVVSPKHQGKGIGKLLAREVTKKADAEGRKCYLESSRDVPNMKIYESMEFHFVKDMDCDDEGEICKLFCMVRDPQVFWRAQLVFPNSRRDFKGDKTYWDVLLL